jgi:phosphoserine phosphatase
MEHWTTRIFLVRHGETEWNRTHRFQGRSDVPLNETGIRQADALASVLQHETLTAVYSSPLIRAMETARRIMVHHPHPLLIEEPDFIEMDLGEFDGMEAREWSRRNPDFMKSWWENPGTLRMPGGENLEEVQQRAVRALHRIVDDHPANSSILICSHNFVILSLLCYVQEISLDGFRTLRQANGAMSILHFDESRMEVVALNQCPYIPQNKMDDNR